MRRSTHAIGAPRELILHRWPSCAARGDVEERVEEVVADLKVHLGP
jgi:hypothetical protein